MESGQRKLQSEREAFKGNAALLKAVWWKQRAGT